jgi:DnaJ-class molecular chaperone
MMGRGARVDHYRTLGVGRDASTREIRRAYRRLARQHHPDLNPADGAGRFVAISGAYKVLSDPEAKARYDRTLTATPSPSPRPHPPAPRVGGPVRIATLELSVEEAAHLSHRPLALTDGSTTIRLPAGLKHGDTIALRDHDRVMVLQIEVKP